MNRMNKMIAADIGTATALPSPVAALRQAWKAIDGWISRSRQRRALAQLDAHLLRDIGVTKYDAAHEAGTPFWK
jgi:uncharacterized protein YjiS (DUF1127 family)